MIKGVHTMFYTSEPESLRAFIRDKLGFPCTDVGGGWLIFDLPEAEMGCHPAERAGPKMSGAHDISFYCDNIEQTVADLRARGVEFTEGITDAGYGRFTHFRVPGRFEVQLYEPRYVKRRSQLTKSLASGQRAKTAKKAASSTRGRRKKTAPNKPARH